MLGSKSNRPSPSNKDSTSPVRTKYNSRKQLPSPPHRRSSSSRSNNPLLLSPTLSSLSSISSSPDFSLLDYNNYSPSSSTSNKFQAPPSPVSVSRDFDMPFPTVRDPSPTLTAALKGKGKGKGKSRASLINEGEEKIVGVPSRNQRQTKIQEHLKSGKPGTSTSTLSKSKSKPINTTPVKRGRKPSTIPKVVKDNDQEVYEPAVVTKETLDLNLLSEHEVQARLSQEKYELKGRLADYGLNPNSDALDQALQNMESRNNPTEGRTVQSFLQAVSSQTKSLPRTESRKPRQSVTFSILESPTRDSSSNQVDQISQPRTPLRSTKGSRSSNPNQALYPTSILSTPTHTLAPSPDILLCTPSELKDGRLSAFSLPKSNSMMVAAELQGMGRVAMSKEVLFDRLGSDTAEKAIIAASDLPSPSLLFGHALPQLLSPIIDAFSSARRRKSKNSTPSSSRVIREEGFSTTQVKDDRRIGLVRAWLDSPEMLEDESRESWSIVPKEWSEDVFNQGPFVEEDLIPVNEMEEIRGGGGKSVRGLVKTKRRRFVQPEELDHDDLDEVEIEDDDVSLLLEDELPVARYASNTKKGKGRAVEVEGTCVCNETEEEEGVAMVRCDDCTIWYHLDCLNIPSAKQLGKEWFCFRCTGTAAPSGPSPSKRAKIVAPTTPVLDREPTFVPSAFSPRPKGNFYRSSAADMVLAPSPQSSPIRRPKPLIAPPTTPQGIHSTRTDYSPRSPLRNRNTRTRIISGSYEESNQLWDHSNFSTSLVEEEQQHPHPSNPQLSFEEEGRIWHDVTMTPSRSLSSSALGWGESIISIPTTPSSIGTRSRISSLALGTSASQDFLSGLHGAQELFSTHSHRQPQLVVPSSSHGPLPPPHFALSSSPLGPRGRPLAISSGHQRKPSLPSNFFHPSSSSSSKIVAPQGMFNSPDRRITSASRTTHFQTVASPRASNTGGEPRSLDD